MNAEKFSICSAFLYNRSFKNIYYCQFMISTHSPFLLAMKGAKIYDLDENPVDVKKWTELENVLAYYDFFKKYEKNFH